MRTFLKIVLAGLGAATIYFLWVVNPLINSSHSAVLHWQGAVSELFFNAFLLFSIFWLFFAILFASARCPGRLRVAIWSATVLLTPWIVIKNVAIITGRVAPFPIRAFSLIVPLLATALLTLFWRPSFRIRFERAARFALTIFIFAGFSGVLLLAELAWFAFAARDLNAPLPLHHAQTAPPLKPRILWIVFDELSYQQVYQTRPPGLQLPAFDQFASQATSYTNVIPAGPLTTVVLPSLLTGQHVDKVRSSPNGRVLSMHHPDTHSWSALEAQDTIFQDALNAGYSTAVVGWFIPYCRLIPSVLDHCTWRFSGLSPGGRAPNTPVLNNMANSLLYSAGTGAVSRVVAYLPFTSPPGDIDLASHIADYKALTAATANILQDPTATFVLLHLPVPHPGGIYNRAAHTFATTHTSYADNLALADQTLAQIRDTLQQSGQWDSSTILIMGDHAWRTPRWETASFWTPEDQCNSHQSPGHHALFDPRPAYLLKRPNQHTQQTIDTPFTAVSTRALLKSLMNP